MGVSRSIWLNSWLNPIKFEWVSLGWFSKKKMKPNPNQPVCKQFGLGWVNGLKHLIFYVFFLKRNIFYKLNFLLNELDTIASCWIFYQKKICDVAALDLIYFTDLTPIYLSIHGRWEIKHTIFEIRSFNKHSKDEFQIFFSIKTNGILRGLLIVNRFEIFLEVHLKWL